VLSKQLPLGMNAMGYSTEFLKDSLKGKEHQHLVTGWGRIFDQSKAVEINLPYKQLPHHRYTLDYPEDELFFREVIDNITVLDLETQKILELVEENQWFGINNHLSEEYLLNFYKEQKDEY
jgi:hypothetical protein